MKVAQQVHGLLAPFGPQLSIELVGALLLVGRVVCHGSAGKQEIRYILVKAETGASSFSEYFGVVVQLASAGYS